MRQGEERLIVRRDPAYHAAQGDPTTRKRCQRGAWPDRLWGATVLSMLTVVCPCQQGRPRVWAYGHARLAFTMATLHVLVQWPGFQPHASGFVPLSSAALSL